ncbi:hypothetical protein LOK49_LG01G01492 [Camellia lanceoleosa]|uniref:Uncharacterized protein n=1 Tax=Camellia lanceoleosa TaxID=1840588 RepID=A0ACC0J133_9ERIC|nr:hypothetical protein LOK49_LG01G01492 [Camellia lanceoleosa]
MESIGCVRIRVCASAAGVLVGICVRWGRWRHDLRKVYSYGPSQVWKPKVFEQRRLHLGKQRVRVNNAFGPAINRVKGFSLGLVPDRSGLGQVNEVEMAMRNVGSMPQGLRKQTRSNPPVSYIFYSLRQGLDSSLVGRVIETGGHVGNQVVNPVEFRADRFDGPFSSKKADLVDSVVNVTNQGLDDDGVCDHDRLEGAEFRQGVEVFQQEAEEVVFRQEKVEKFVLGR